MSKKLVVFDNNINAEMKEKHIITEMAQSQISKNNKMLFHLLSVSKSHD